MRHCNPKKRPFLAITEPLPASVYGGLKCVRSQAMDQSLRVACCSSLAWRNAGCRSALRQSPRRWYRCGWCHGRSEFSTWPVRRTWISDRHAAVRLRLNSRASSSLPWAFASELSSSQCHAKVRPLVSRGIGNPLEAHVAAHLAQRTPFVFLHPRLDVVAERAEIRGAVTK